MHRQLALSIVKDEAEMFPVVAYGSLLEALSQYAIEPDEREVKELMDYAVSRGWVNRHETYLDVWTSNICAMPSYR